MVTSVPSEFPLTGVSHPNTKTNPTNKGPRLWLLALPHDPWRHVTPELWRHNAGASTAEAVKNKPGSLDAWRSHKTGLFYCGVAYIML